MTQITGYTTTESIEQAVPRLHRLAADDYSSRTLAAVFGARTLRLIAEGRDPYEAARLAVWFAERYLDERPKVIGRISPEEPWGGETTCLVSDADYRKYWK